MEIIFEFKDFKVAGNLNETKAAQTIYQKLPTESKVSKWGDEIYFQIPAKLSEEPTTMDLNVGDIAYWPEGSCLCLFFGRTPASTDHRPKPASPVSIVGSFKASFDMLRKVGSGTAVRIVTA